jgi:hypothetical protein
MTVSINKTYRLRHTYIYKHICIYTASPPLMIPIPTVIHIFMNNVFTYSWIIFHIQYYKMKHLLVNISI